MSDSKLQSPRQRALQDARERACPPLWARVGVDAVFYRLTEPDREMLEAGAAELKIALPEEKPAYLRELAGVVWRSMLEAA